MSENPQTNTPMPTWADCKADPKRAQQLTTVLDLAVQESYNQMQYWNTFTRGISNFYLYLGWTQTGYTKYAVRRNRIQGVIMANAAIQVGDRPTATFKPREFDEPPEYYINTMLDLTPPDGEQDEYATIATTDVPQVNADAPEVAAGEGYGAGGSPQQPPIQAPAQSQMAQVLAALRPETYQPTEDEPQQPLNAREAAFVKNQVAVARQQRLQAAATGQAEPLGILPEDFLLTVDESEEAEASQLLLDNFTERSQFTMKVQQNEIYCNIFGHQMMLCELDKPRNKFLYRNCELGTVWPDPFKTDIADMDRIIFDEYLGEYEGIACYPELKDVILKNAVQGPPTPPGFMPAGTMVPWFRGFIGRRVIIIRHAWYRNQAFPMTPEQVLGKGLVLAVSVPAAPVPVASVGPNPMEQAAEKVVMGEQDAGMAGAVEPAGDSGDLPVDGTVDGSIGAPAAPPRSAYYLPDEQGNPDEVTGEVDTLHPKWPTRLGIREILSVASTIVEDKESERCEFPLGHNVNIPIPFTPWGQGEPERLESLQAAYNSTITDNVEMGKVAAFPARLCRQSFALKHESILKKGFTQPGRIYPVDDTIADRVGLDKVVVNVPAGEMPKDNWQREAMLDRCFKDESGESEVLQGDLPTQAAMSGEAISSLQGAATNSIKIKSERLKDMLAYLYKLMLYDIVQQYTPEELAKLVRGYPVAVWERLHRRLETYALEAEITVEITSTASKSAANTAALDNAAAAGLPVSPQTRMKKHNLDPDVEKRNTLEWNASMAPQQAQQEQQPQKGVKNA